LETDHASQARLIAIVLSPGGALPHGVPMRGKIIALAIHYDFYLEGDSIESRVSYVEDQYS
jgi:hypothetical protein